MYITDSSTTPHHCQWQLQFFQSVDSFIVLLLIWWLSSLFVFEKTIKFCFWEDGHHLRHRAIDNLSEYLVRCRIGKRRRSHSLQNKYILFLEIIYQRRRIKFNLFLQISPFKISTNSWKPLFPHQLLWEHHLSSIHLFHASILSSSVRRNPFCNL